MDGPFSSHRPFAFKMRLYSSRYIVTRDSCEMGKNLSEHPYSKSRNLDNTPRSARRDVWNLVPPRPVAAAK